MQRRFLAIAMSLSIVVIALACGGSETVPRSNVDLHAHLDRTPPDDGDWTIEEARNFKDFDLYWLGEKFQGLPLTKIIRLKTNPSAGSLQDSVWFVYGTCKTTGAEGGCPAPLSIQIQRFCNNRQIYDSERASVLKFRGGGEAAPGTGDLPFYVWTGAVSIRISGLLEASAADALVSLTGLGPASPSDPLPQLAADC